MPNIYIEVWEKDSCTCFIFLPSLVYTLPRWSRHGGRFVRGCLANRNTAGRRSLRLGTMCTVSVTLIEYHLWHVRQICRYVHMLKTKPILKDVYPSSVACHYVSEPGACPEFRDRVGARGTNFKTIYQNIKAIINIKVIINQSINKPPKTQFAGFQNNLGGGGGMGLCPNLPSRPVDTPLQVPAGPKNRT